MSAIRTQDVVPLQKPDKNSIVKSENLFPTDFINHSQPIQSSRMASEFVWSLKNGDLEQAQEYITHNKIDINETIDGRMPIHYAADYGQKDIIAFLIEKGANVNALDKHGISPLLAAIWEGHTECVKLMIDRGASVSGKTPDGSSYLDAAEKPEIKQLLSIK